MTKVMVSVLTMMIAVPLALAIYLLIFFLANNLVDFMSCKRMERTAVDVLVESISSQEWAKGVSEINGCKIPPAGWVCTRKKGHEGPCAAWPVEDNDG